MRLPQLPSLSRRALLAAGAAYLLVLVGLSLWRRIWLTPDYLLLLLLPLAFLSGKLVRFLLDWTPFVAMLLAWEAMRAIAPLLGMPVHHAGYRIDTLLFQSRFPTLVLQDLLHHGPGGAILDQVTSAVYILHFAVTFGIGMLLWLTSRPHFIRYGVALLTFSLVAFVLFLVYPTAPPWMGAEDNYLQGMDHILANTLPVSMSPYYRALNPNTVAALPSLHAAFPVIGFFALRQLWPRAAWMALAWSVLVWFSVVYLGEHYVADVIAGAALAAGWWHAMPRWLGMLEGRILIGRLRSLGPLLTPTSPSPRGEENTA